MCELYHITTVSALAPEEKYTLGRGHLAENTLLHRQVEPGIIRIRDKQTQCGHGRFPFLRRGRFSRCQRRLQREIRKVQVDYSFFSFSSFLHRLAGGKQERGLAASGFVFLQQGTSQYD
jgi:hypothetical protein